MLRIFSSLHLKLCFSLNLCQGFFRGKPSICLKRRKMRLLHSTVDLLYIVLNLLFLLEPTFLEITIKSHFFRIFYTDIFSCEKMQIFWCISSKCFWFWYEKQKCSRHWEQKDRSDLYNEYIKGASEKYVTR